MSEKKLSASTVTSLATKLDEFQGVLTEDERAILLGLLGLAGSAIESSHSNIESEGGTIAAQPLSVNRPARALPNLSEVFKESFQKIGIPGSGPVEDSIGVGVGCVSWSKDYNKFEVGAVINPVADPIAAKGIRGLRTVR